MNDKKAVIAVLALAVPAIIENIAGTLVAMIDTAMVGSLGPAATAATALNASPSWLVTALAIMVSGGSTVMIAHLWGAKDYKAASDYARQSFTLSIILGSIIMAIMLIIAPYYPVWMNAADDVAPNATAYMQIFSFAMIPHLISINLYGVVRGSGDTKTPMIVSMGANVLNVIGNFLLIYPTRTLSIFGGVTMWGAGLGVKGAAISTAVSLGLSGVVMLIIMLKRNDTLRFGTNMSFALQNQSTRRMLRLGIPMAGERVAITAGQIAFTFIVSSLGTISLSAHHLATTAEGMCYNPAFGFSVAATTMVGQALGAQDVKLAQKYGNINMWLCVITMTGVSAMMYFFAPSIMSFFTSDIQVVEQGTQALRIVAFIEPVFGIYIVTSGILRGAGDAIVPLWIGIICMLFVRLIAAIILVKVLNIGLAGAWYAMCIDLVLRGILIFIRYKSGKWIKRAFAT